MEWSKLDNSPGALRAFLESEGLAPKKRFGQNFMISPGARKAVVDGLGIRGTDLVWEIGPGLGAITALLVGAAGRVVVFEIDHGIIGVLRRRFGDEITVVTGDAVRTLKSAVEGPDAAVPDIVAGNLPYRSAAAIIASVLESAPIAGHARRMAFTVQKEMALRMTAGPGQKDYSPLSVLCTLAAQVHLECDLAAGSFYPVPEVVSSLVSLTPRSIDRELLRLASVSARALFTSRRKTVRNNAGTLASAVGLTAADLLDALDAAGVDITLRAEALAPETYLELAEVLAARKVPNSEAGPTLG